MNHAWQTKGDAGKTPGLIFGGPPKKPGAQPGTMPGKLKGRAGKTSGLIFGARQKKPGAQPGTMPGKLRATPVKPRSHFGGPLKKCRSSDRKHAWRTKGHAGKSQGLILGARQKKAGAQPGTMPCELRAMLVKARGSAKEGGEKKHPDSQGQCLGLQLCSQGKARGSGLSNPRKEAKVTPRYARYAT